MKNDTIGIAFKLDSGKRSQRTDGPGGVYRVPFPTAFEPFTVRTGLESQSLTTPDTRPYYIKVAFGCRQVPSPLPRSRRDLALARVHALGYTRRFGISIQ